ncbi:kinesin-like protein KIF19 [Brachionichthys hirsutus]|uniref:kinesin-like protein KIF19 n=1 Tax=Brachionichthys hirsutus TaxID=412623 RepID=UPI003604A3E7
MKETGEGKDHQLTVALRIRPLSKAEREEEAAAVAFRLDTQMIVLMDPMEDAANILRANRNREKAFRFDVALDESASQEEVYRATTKGLIEGLMSGYNATVFAYGPTGCGKTYTMLGTDEEPGICVRMLNDLFRAVEKTSDEVLSSISMSYLEIYNEMILDLLNPSSGFLDLREDGKGVVQVAGITEVSTINAQAIMELMKRGNKERSQEPTAANQTSSRSHAVLQVTVKQQNRCRDIEQEVRFARLFMIDLAGSERAAQTQNRGQRLKEGAHINLSLLALGNCINALSDKHGAKYVNFRDSKLTRLLKDSLCGNSRTVMIAHISPASTAFEESRNTLTYAERAKNIRTRVRKNMVNVTHHITQYTNIISDLRCENARLKKKIADQTSHADRADIRHVQAEVQAHSTQQSQEEMEKLRKQLSDAVRQQMEIRKELENRNLKVEINTSKHLLTIVDWEQNKRRKKWRAENMKESVKKDESELDSDALDCPESQEGASARESLDTLMDKQKKIHKKKTSLECRFLEIRNRTRHLEQLLPQQVSSEQQRELLDLLCNFHELEITNAEMLKDNVILQKIVVVRRFKQHRHLCDGIIQQQRRLIDNHSLPVPPHLQQLYETYTRELDERRADRRMALDKVTNRHAAKGGSLPKIAVRSRRQDSMQDTDSDQESVRNTCADNGRSQVRQTFPPILPEPVLDDDRVFKNSPLTRKMKNPAVMTPPPIHVNGRGNRELQPPTTESSLSYTHLSHSVSGRLGSSPESSETGADAPPSRREQRQILKGVQNIAVKAACLRSKAMEQDALRFPPPPSPLDHKKQKSSFSQIEGPPRGLPMPRGRQPSLELRHATSDDNLSCCTVEAPSQLATWTRVRNRQAASKNQTARDVAFGVHHKKRRSHSFEVTGHAVLQAKATAALRLRPLDSTSDTHLHNNVQSQVPTLRPQNRGVPPLTKTRPHPHRHSTGPAAEPSTVHTNNPRRATQLQQPPFYVTTAGAGGQRTRKH